MPGPGRADRRLRIPGWLVLATMLGVGASAAIAIAWLRLRADESHEIQDLLTQVGAGANRLNTLRWLVRSEGRADPELLRTAVEARGDIERSLGALGRLDPDTRVREAYLEYAAAMKDEMALVNAGRLSAARTVRADRGDPSYVVFVSAIAETRSIASQQGRQATRSADAGSAVVLGSAALLIGLLFWRFDRARQATTRLATQEEALVRSERRLRGLVQNASDVILIVDPEGGIQYVTSSLSPVLGFSPEAWAGARLGDQVHPDDAAALRRCLAECAKAEGSSSVVELRAQRSEGAWRQLEAIATNRLEDSSIAGIVVTCRDVTERRRAAEQSQRASTLAATGQLASGVAHHLNNVLAVILGRAQLLERHVESDAARRGVGIIVKATLDGAAKIKQLQSFARVRAEETAQPIPVEELLRDVIDFTRGKWYDDAHARGVNYDVALAAIPAALLKGSAVELREVFTNLVINALEAMPGGGRLTLGASLEQGEVHIRVADTGVGIGAELRQRIFEPFFTTKGPAGNGLGLAVSYGIVERHGGRIEVESEPGRGTVFTVVLPPSQAPGEGGPRGAVEEAARLRALVVDDEDEVRDTLAELLRELGHEVVAAASGAEALDRLGQRSFDFVFTDLSMPGMDGWTVAQRVRESQPEARIVLVSGYGATVELAGPKAALVDSVISKPIGLAALESALRRLLDASRTPPSRP